VKSLLWSFLVISKNSTEFWGSCLPPRRGAPFLMGRLTPSEGFRTSVFWRFPFSSPVVGFLSNDSLGSSLLLRPAVEAKSPLPLPFLFLFFYLFGTRVFFFLPAFYYTYAMRPAAGLLCLFCASPPPWLCPAAKFPFSPLFPYPLDVLYFSCLLERDPGHPRMAVRPQFLFLFKTPFKVE